jgi:hypothetical protein
MADGYFFGSARWLLRRLLVALLAALAVAVVTRQFTDLGGVATAGQRPATVRGPFVGRDHWHALYAVFICGQRQPNFPSWEAGVHTHADGVIHIHPFIPSEEEEGARLTKWFEYGGGKLTQTEMHMPGTPGDQVYRNGDRCPDGSEGVLQVFVNGERLDDWSDYIPQDGDRIWVEFGPPE